MILSFKNKFKDPILKGTKIHTIREDKPNRWKRGNEIHFATGVRTKNYNCFEELSCWSVQGFEIKFIINPKHTEVLIYVDGFRYGFARIIKCKVSAYSKTLHDLAINDGFKDVNEFLEWFSEDFKGKIIHWTNKKY